ncbi:MAG: hypothetical protein QME81_02120, partial [bacterium]|nr:hypothetical protein [bacterium]
SVLSYCGLRIAVLIIVSATLRRSTVNSLRATFCGLWTLWTVDSIPTGRNDDQGYPLQKSW